MANDFQLIIITGMSGAGKTVAMRSLEDLGFFNIDNLPPSLLPKFLELVKESDKLNKVALAIDLRSRAFYADVINTLGDLSNNNNARIIFWMRQMKNSFPATKKRGVLIRWPEMVESWKVFKRSANFSLKCVDLPIR